MKYLLIATSAAALASTGTHAAIVLDNLSSPAVGVLSYKGPQGIIPYQELGFVLDAGMNSAFTLDSIRIGFHSAVNTGTLSEISLWTYGDAQNPQGTFITTLLGSSSPSSAVETYTPSTPVTVAAGEDIFVRLNVSSGTGWYRVQSSTDPYPTSDWSFGGAYLKGNSGGWVSTGGNVSLEVNATAVVPEPGSTAMLACALLPLLARRRVRARA